jgi:hypothetical protein
MAATNILAQDRLVRKEESLGTIRDTPPPLDHIGLGIVPFLPVETDEVVFDYVQNGLQDVLAPARAEDAESRLMQFDEFLNGSGRASVIDWAFKNKYTASDVTRYRDNLTLAAATSNLNLSLNPSVSAAQQFAARVARDDARRKRSLDNRLEWLIMTSLDTGKLVYNDGKIQFTINWGRPTDQDNMAPAGGLWDSGVTFDPIGDLMVVQQLAWDRYRIKLDKAITSQKVVNQIWKSNRFLAAVGMPVVGGTPNVPLDPHYLLPGYSVDAALGVLERATGITFRVYDSVYQTRPMGSTVTTNQRFTTEKSILLLPSDASLGEIDDTVIGFGKMLTSPHAEGNWASGFYEWEQETVDPWMHVRGSGIKAFPVLPYMKYTFSLDVLAA